MRKSLFCGMVLTATLVLMSAGCVHYGGTPVVFPPVATISNPKQNAGASKPCGDSSSVPATRPDSCYPCADVTKCDPAALRPASSSTPEPAGALLPQ